jgi:hypothetical protein
MFRWFFAETQEKYPMKTCNIVFINFNRRREQQEVLPVYIWLDLLFKGSIIIIKGSQSSNMPGEVRPVGAFRLGFVRRNKRDYHFHQRSTGKDARDRLELILGSQKYRKLLMLALLNWRQEEADEKNAIGFARTSNQFLLLSLLLRRRLQDINRPRLIDLLPLLKVDVTFETFNDEWYASNMNWSRTDLKEMIGVMHFPESIHMREDDMPKSRWQISGVKAIHIFLHRYSSPSQRQAEDEKLWGYRYSTLGQIFNTVAKWWDDVHGWRLQRLHDVRRRLSLSILIINDTSLILFLFV